MIYAFLSESPAWSADAGQLWGGAVRPPAGALSFTGSSDRHYVDGLGAVTIEGGGNTLLPGASLNAIGVYNQISVVGDNNMIDAIQDGDNSGDVTNTVDLAE